MRTAVPWFGGGAGRSIWRRAPFVLLVLSLLLAGAGAFEAQRAMLGHRAAVDRVLADYAGFAAWTFGRYAEEEFPLWVEATFQPVIRSLRVGAPLPDPGVLLAEARPHRDDCNCRSSLAGSFALKIPISHGGERVEVSGNLLDPERHAAVIEEIRAVGLAAGEENRMKGMVSVDLEGSRRLVAVFAVGCPHGEGFEAIYGVEVAPDRLREVFRDIHAKRSLLPPTLSGDGGNEGILRIAVDEPDGPVLFGERLFGDELRVARASLGFAYGGLEVSAAVAPEAASRLVIGGLPRSRAPWMMGLFALALLLAVVAVDQLRRDNELALIRSDFVASASHELRTPLAQIRLFLETLRMGRFQTEREREWSLATIDRETRRLTHLVENILHFSRAERGLVPGDPEPLDVVAELVDIEASFRPLAVTRGVCIELDTDPDVTVVLHRDSFRQAVLNLLDNAVKFGPAGQTIRMEARRREDRVQVVVTDEGPGVGPEDRLRIWEAFQRGSGKAGRATGSGIGLAVVRTIVERGGGEARVETASGGGAQFVLDLPRADNPAPGRTNDPIPAPEWSQRRVGEPAVPAAPREVPA